jgi:hypothetical protein
MRLREDDHWHVGPTRLLVEYLQQDFDVRVEQCPVREHHCPNTAFHFAGQRREICTDHARDRCFLQQRARDFRVATSGRNEKKPFIVTVLVR